MKFLILVLCSIFLIACGGSGSGGSSNDGGRTCFDKCMQDPDYKPQGGSVAVVTNKQAEKLIYKNERNLLDIKPGLHFKVISSCFIGSSAATQKTKYVRDFVVLEFDQNSREIKYLVKNIETPDNTQCEIDQDYIKDDKYVLLGSIPSMEEVRDLFAMMDKVHSQVDRRGYQYLVMEKDLTEENTGYGRVKTYVEVGLNLSVPFPIALYTEVNAHVEEHGITYGAKNYMEKLSSVNVSNIDISSLNVYLEDSSSTFGNKVLNK